MSSYRIRKSNLQGSITVPSSKSQTLRAILFASLAKGKSIINKYLQSTDTQAMIHACRLLGAKIEIFPQHLEIEGIAGQVHQFEDVIQSGNSGIVLRFLTAIGALSPYYTVITGDHSIRHQRPIQPLLDGLKQLSAFAVSTKADGFAPVIIRGPLKPGTVTISGEDSQPVSALLIASAFVEGKIDIKVKNPGEKPWVSLTLNWFDRLGIQYTNDRFENYQVFGKCSYEGFSYTVPGDFSTAAFPLVAALVTQSELVLENIDIHDPQGDKELIFVLQRMGAHIEIDDLQKQVIVKKTKQLNGIAVNVNSFIDAVPILSVAACYAQGETRITNAGIARNKECDRLHAMTVELQKMGAKITEFPDALHIQGSSLRGAEMFSHQDHRIAMALMVAGLNAEGETTIKDVDCIAKTFPNAAIAFQDVGAAMDIIK